MLSNPTGLAHYITGRDWFIERRRLESIARVLAGITELPERPKAETPGTERADRKKPYQVAGATAVISIEGIITPDAWFYRWFGIAATDPWEANAAIREALDDRDIENLLLVIDSPGGHSTGIKELSDVVYAGRSRKPVHAHATDMADSAAYWVGAQATEFSANAIAKVGCIGVFSVLYDMSKAAEDAGIRVIVVRSGPYKGTGVPGAPISDKEVEPYQEIVDDMTSAFVADVARGRVANVAAVRALATGRDWLAPRAVGLGLIDRVSTYDAALERVASVSGEGVL